MSFETIQNRKTSVVGSFDCAAASSKLAIRSLALSYLSGQPAATKLVTRYGRLFRWAMVLVMVTLGLSTTARHARADAWYQTNSMNTGRYLHTATLLVDGRVLVTGGLGSSALSSAEIFDPATNTWAAAAPMVTARYGHTATLLADGKVLVTGGFNGGSLTSSEIYDPTTNTWTTAAPMSTARQYHTATLLINGRVLVTGGRFSSSAEIYDPVSNTWSSAGSMSVVRSNHTATLIAGEKVLVTGGWTGSLYLSSAEIYDPATNTWAAAASMASARYIHTATSIFGKVLVTGGYTGSTYVSSAEIYDPATNTWAGTAPMSTFRGAHTATSLGNGQVLVAGGSGGIGGVQIASTEIYDPASGTWRSAGAISASRYSQTTTLLADGRVLVAGGWGGSPLGTTDILDPREVPDWTLTVPMSTAREGHRATLLEDGSGDVLVTGGYSGSSYLSSAEKFEPTSNSWVAAVPMNTPRYGHSSTSIGGGKVLVAGGYAGGNTYIATAQIYDPSTNTWANAAPMGTPRYLHAAIAIAGGKVLVIGGYNGSAYLATTQIYDPVTNTWGNAAPMSTARGFSPTATLLPNGKVLVTGGGTNSGNLQTAEIYDPSTNTWTSAAPMSTARAFHTATLLGNGQVLVTGGYTGGGVYSASAEIYDPGSNTWSSAGSLSAARYQHTATLLADGTGRVVVTGGLNNSSQLASVNIYDPMSNSWSFAASLESARYGHTATLLGDGRVLVVGGTAGGSSYSSSAELFLETPDNQIITFGPLPNNKIFGDPPFTISATASSGLPVTFSSVGSCSVSGNTVTILRAGLCTITANQSGNSFWNPAPPVAQRFTVARVTPTINWINPADINYGTALSGTQLNATASVTGSFVYTPAAGTVLNVGNGQTLSVKFIPSNLTNYNGATASVSINVLKATPLITWSNPADNIYGTALSGLQLNATASVAGSFVYTPAAGTVLNVGNGQTLSVVFTPTDTTNYNSAMASVSINVLKATPVITWIDPATIVYGAPLSGTQLNATASVAGTFTYTPPAGTVLDAGNGQTLHVDFTPVDTANYNNASKDVNINVYFAKPIVLWDNPADITYGTPLSSVQLNATADVPGTFTYTPPEGTVLNAGTNQSLQVVFQPDNPNYTGKGLSVRINVEKAPAKLQMGAPFRASKAGGIHPSVGDPPFTATASSNSDAPIIFSVGPPTVCMSGGIDGSTITIVGYGLCAGTALQEETANYTAGSASGSFYVNGRPVANAGIDQTVDEIAPVMLNGLASSDPENDALTYTWTQVGGTTVALDNSTASQPSFTAPSLTYLQDGSVLTFQLVVNDGLVDSLPAVVNVTVKNVNKLPIALASTTAPTVNEGSPGVALKGSDSYDPDGEALAYSWLQTGGPAVTLSDPSAANPAFDAPLVGQAGALLAFQLTVTDPVGGTNTASVDVQVENVNHPPVANAGTNQTVNENTLVTLDGTASSDPDNDSLSFSWSQVSGTPVTLSANNVDKPTFTAPAVGPAGDTLSFKLTVNDGLVDSGESYVNVLVQNVSDPPSVAHAQPSCGKLWPPNHKLVPISILGVGDRGRSRDRGDYDDDDCQNAGRNDNRDDDDGGWRLRNITIRITGVSQDEPTNGLGDGDTPIDAIVSPDGTSVLLRAERSGKGNGRVYHIHFTASNSSGSASGMVKVSVPRDKKRDTAVDGGELYDSTGP